MTALAFTRTLSTHQCQLCPTQIPADRTRCYFHTKHVPPRALDSPHPEIHVSKDLLPLYGLLCQPLTYEEIAERMGPGYTRRTVEHGWQRLRGQLGLDRGIGKAAERIALVRMALGADGCFCRKSGANL